MQALGERNGTATLAEIKASFDEYWLTHDPNIKGSGHKPFMRWYTNVENQIKEDGTLENYDDLMLAFNQKSNNEILNLLPLQVIGRQYTEHNLISILVRGLLGKAE
jgi:hypothetical protein